MPRSGVLMDRISSPSVEIGGLGKSGERGRSPAFDGWESVGSVELTKD